MYNHLYINHLTVKCNALLRIVYFVTPSKHFVNTHTYLLQSVFHLPSFVLSNLLNQSTDFIKTCSVQHQFFGRLEGTYHAHYSFPLGRLHLLAWVWLH
jgi:hypothetical protein